MRTVGRYSFDFGYVALLPKLDDKLLCKVMI